MSHVAVPTAGQLRPGDLHRPDGVTGWRTVLGVETVPGGRGEAVEVTLNSRTESKKFVQYYGPDETVDALRSKLSEYIGELKA